MSAPFSQNVELVGPSASCAPQAGGSQTYTFVAPNAGLYSVDWKLQLPNLSQGGGTSGCILQIINATGPVTIFTSTAGQDGGHVDFLCAAGDSVSINLSSVTAADLLSLNTLKATLAISQGV